MNTCKTCKHWSAPTQIEVYAPDGYGICDSELLAEAGDFPPRQDMLVYSYNESGYFSTGPGFGCVHWEGDSPNDKALLNSCHSLLSGLLADGCLEFPEYRKAEFFNRANDIYELLLQHGCGPSKD